MGGWVTLVSNLKAAAQARYRVAQKRNAEWLEHQKAGTELPIFLQLREGGPATGVNWCVPILPCVFLADSYEVLGPLSGTGTIKIVFYYGVGSAVICELCGWIS